MLIRCAIWLSVNCLESTLLTFLLNLQTQGGGSTRAGARRGGFGELVSSSQGSSLGTLLRLCGQRAPSVLHGAAAASSYLLLDQGLWYLQQLPWWPGSVGGGEADCAQGRRALSFLVLLQRQAGEKAKSPDSSSDGFAW